ncbi:MAG: hypothetical protein WA610_00680, partial [Thermodesulfovibrionales bacterium]
MLLRKYKSGELENNTFRVIYPSVLPLSQGRANSSPGSIFRLPVNSVTGQAEQCQGETMNFIERIRERKSAVGII